MVIILPGNCDKNTVKMSKICEQNIKYLFMILGKSGRRKQKKEAGGKRWETGAETGGTKKVTF